MIAPALSSVSMQKKDSVVMMLTKIALLMIIGILCLSRFPIIVNVAALGIMTLVFLHSLMQKDHFSFFVQLLFCNHFILGSDNGGLYNVAALLALGAYYILYDRAALNKRSLFGKTGYILFAILLGSQLIAVMANYRIGMSAKAFSFGVFLLMLTIVYNLSKLKVVYEDYIRLIYVLFFFTGYMLAVAINQRLYLIDLPIFPTGDPNAEFELNLVRSGSTFLNYEAYGEYSLSLIALLLPGILTGRTKKMSISLFLVSLSIIIMCLFAIVLSGTRSSLLLLPLVFLFIAFCLGRRMKVSYLISFFGLAIGAFIVNSKYEFVDVSIFMERSANMDFAHMSIKDLLSGSEMNRGDIFEYGFKKINDSKGLIGAGYYTKEENYVVAHFDRLNYLPTDYHNLYLSSVVLWGAFGAIALLLFFFISVYQGLKVYFRKRHLNDFSIDLLLGFNTFFVFFLLNEYKIQFIRTSNYFVLIFLFLILYRSLIVNIKSNFDEPKVNS
ncbi:O-antigen ligase family protein [Flavisolibacter sp. BT320]|nr:O-antigen ligase family protein [Flavisolibacter longurius]